MRYTQSNLAQYTPDKAGTVIPKAMVGEFLSDYLKAFKQGKEVYGMICISVIIGLKQVYNEADKNRVLKFLNGTGKSNRQSVIVKAYIFSNSNDYNNYYDNFLDESGAITLASKYQGKGIKDADGKEVDIWRGNANIVALNNGELIDILRANGSQKAFSLDVIMDRLKREYPYFVRGTGLNYVDFQIENLGR